MTFESEITAPVTVEVLDATRATPGRYRTPERSFPGDGDSVAISVRLGGIEITDALASDVLEALASEALDRLAEP